MNDTIYLYTNYNSIVLGGGPILFIRLADALSKKNRKVFVLCNKGSVMFNTIENNYKNINVIDITSKEKPINLLDNSILVSPMIINHKFIGKNIRVFKWHISPYMYVAFPYSSFKAIYSLDDYVRYYTKKDALLYIHSTSFEEYFKRKPNIKEQSLIVHIPVPEVNFECNKNLVADNEINIAWLGRLENFKMPSVLAILENFNRYESQKRKIVHIIGGGKDEHLIKPELYPNIEIIMCGKLYGDDLYSYLCTKVDLLVAMGTSLIEGAIIKLPALYVPFMQNYFNTNNIVSNFIKIEYFIWLFSNNNSFSTAEKVHKCKEKTTLSKALDEIYINNKKAEFGKKSYEAFKKYNSIDQVASDFLRNVDNPKAGVLYEDHIKLLNNFKLRFIDRVLRKIYREIGKYLDSQRIKK